MSRINVTEEKFSSIKAYIKDHPNRTNKEIAEFSGWSKDTISRVRKCNDWEQYKKLIKMLNQKSKKTNSINKKQSSTKIDPFDTICQLRNTISKIKNTKQNECVILTSEQAQLLTTYIEHLEKGSVKEV